MNDTAAHYYANMVVNGNWAQPFIQPNNLRATLTAICQDRTRILELDVAMWYGTIQQSPEPMKTFLKRMFTTIHWGGLLYKSRPNGAWRMWSQMPIPVTNPLSPQCPLASTMSHGGRILIQLPKELTVSQDFFNWMTNGIAFESGIGQQFATHGVSRLSVPTALLQHRQKFLKEEHGKTTAFANVGNHKRKNVGIGGPGNVNPWTGIQIAADGNHGQLYLYSWPPTKTSVGAIMLSLESEAPGRTGQTGHGHGAGASSEEFCATGGPKWKINPQDALMGFMEMPSSDINERYDGMIIDLIGAEDGTEIAWIKNQAGQFDMEWLVQVPQPPLNIGAASLLIHEGNPRWVADNAHPNCARIGCPTILTKGHRHHCRLCGELFCDDCCPELPNGIPNYNFTNLPLPAKTTDIAIAGPVRVCGACFRNRTGYDWVRDSQQNTCAFCQRVIGKGSRHHCRYCGRLFCSTHCSRTYAAPQMGYPYAAKICDTCYGHRGNFR